MAKGRKSYTKEFKIEAVKMVTEQGYGLTQVAGDLGITTSMLTRWRREMAEDPEYAFPGKGHLKEPEEEIRRLEREVQRLRMERDILKKQSLSSRKARNEVPGDREVPGLLPGEGHVPAAGSVRERLLCLA